MTDEEKIKEAAELLNSIDPTPENVKKLFNLLDDLVHDEVVIYAEYEPMSGDM